MLNKLSIKQKFIFTIILAVLIPSLVVGILGQNSAREVISQRMLGAELPNLLLQIRYRIERQIGGLADAAKQLGEDPLLNDWLQRGLPDAEEPLLEKKLQALYDQYSLSQASYADRQSAAYYTQQGLLRVLNREQDSWFFAYRDSGQATMLKLYTTPETGVVQLFINYQQVNGRALVGLAKSLNDMAELVSSFKIETSGQVYLVDGAGTVEIHRNKALAGKTKLQQLYGNADLQQLMQKQQMALTTVDSPKGKLLLASSYMPDLGWYLVAEVPQSEVFAELDRATWQILVWTLVICASFIILAVLGGGSISRPISAAAKMFEELGRGDGDLRKRLPEDGADELSRLARGFNRFVDKIQQSMQAVASTSNNLTESAQEAATHSRQTAQDSQTQHGHAMTVATAVNQMGATVNEIAANAAQAADAAKEADSDAANGQVVVSRAKATISELSHDISDMAAIIANLSQNTDAIGSILDVIRSISDQTNLLALNAAIEAARAGEAGRGFSVVADEVRNLAARTANSTDEVQQMIDKLQAEAGNAVNAMQRSQQRSKQGVQAADEAAAALEQIIARISVITEMNIQVAAATEEQSSVVNEINHHLTDISDVTARSETRAAEGAEASEQLNKLAASLTQLVGQFRI
ncbi:methyl-accepting chemotaxis protein [Shewanella sp. A3A]|nr:methyl-accepting chemotaxis protein [Shewanella ferrihydritica]